MQENPYRFTGPLHPVDHQIVCAPRNDEIAKVAAGIKKGDYWSIIGPGQIGKTTLLKQLMHILSGYYHIYIDMESTPENSTEFYEMLIRAIIENIPCKPIDGDIKEYASETHFYDFLKVFKPEENKGIILFFDEIEKAYSLHSFLHLWRRVFHERDFHKNLGNYTVIAAGKAELSSLTAGEDADISPFNIARTLNLKELVREECEKLIHTPFKLPGTGIEPEAAEKIIDQTHGHPQLLQNLCHILIEDKKGETGTIKGADVDAAVERLFLENTNLKTLLKDIRTGKIPEDLIKNILLGKKIGYLPFQDLSITGAGPIVNDGRYCAIRNKIYAEFLKQVIDLKSPADDSSGSPQSEQTAAPAREKPEPPEQPDRQEEPAFTTTIYFEEQPGVFDSEEKEKEFLTKLFKSYNKKIEIVKNDKIEILKGLSFKEELTFCYLAYKNYKAVNKEGFVNWERIPHTYRYYLSSSIGNNEENQKLEWEILKYALKKITGDGFIGDSIRTWIFTLRKKLEKIGAEGIIFSKPGKGSGYLLKGTVHFEISQQR